MPIGTPVIHLTREDHAAILARYYATEGYEVVNIVWNADDTTMVILAELPTTMTTGPTDRADHAHVRVVDDAPEKIGKPAAGANELSTVGAVKVTSTDEYTMVQGGDAAVQTNWVADADAPRHKLDKQERVDGRRDRMLRIRQEQEAEQEMLDNGTPATTIQRRYIRINEKK